MTQADSTPRSISRAEASLLQAWLVLLRVRIAGMVFAVTLCGALLAGELGTGYSASLEVALYVTLVTGSRSPWSVSWTTAPASATANSPRRSPPSG